MQVRPFTHTKKKKKMRSNLFFFFFPLKQHHYLAQIAAVDCQALAILMGLAVVETFIQELIALFLFAKVSNLTPVLESSMDPLLHVHNLPTIFSSAVKFLLNAQPNTWITSLVFL
jgi:hypothetical protein